MAKKKTSPHQSARKLPCIGIWNRTDSHEPTAGNTLVGLWQGVDSSDEIGFFCAIYTDSVGNAIDPDDLEVDDNGFSEYYRIEYYSRQANAGFDTVIDAPDYWAECRFLVPSF